MTSLNLKSDAEGFLIGELMRDFDKMERDIHTMSVDIAAIRAVLAGNPDTISSLASSQSAKQQERTATLIPIGRNQASSASERSPSTATATPKKMESGSGKQKAPKRDESGRFVAAANKPEAGKTVTPNAADSRLSDLPGRIKDAVTDAVIGTERLDPTIQAMQEVVTPISRGFGMIFGDGNERKKERWYKRIWTTLRRKEISDSKATIVTHKRLKAIEEKPISDGGIGWFALLLPILLGIAKAIFSLPMALAGSIAGALAKLLPGFLARRLPGMDFPGRNGRGGAGAPIPENGRNRGGTQAPKKRGKWGRIFDLGKDKAGKAVAFGKEKLGRVAEIGTEAAKKGGGFLAGIGKRIGKVRGLGAIGGLLALAGVVNTETDNTLTREEKNREHGSTIGRASAGMAGAAAGAAIGTAIFPVVGTAIGGIVGAIAADFFAGDALSELGARFGTWITGLEWRDIPGMIGNQVGEWVNSLLLSDIGQYIKSQWDAVTSGAIQMWNNAILTFTGWIDDLKKTDIGKFITESWQSIIDGVASTWNTFVQFLSDKFHIDLGKIGTNVVDSIIETGKNLKQGADNIVGGVSGAYDWAKDKAKAGYEATKDYAVNAIGTMTGAKQDSVSGLIHWGESKRRGYNDYNRGGAGAASNRENIDLTNMTIGEIMEKQRLPKGHKDRIFAAGKYQIIGSSDPDNDTMGAAVNALGLDKNSKFDEAMQERIFTEYLAKEKRKPIENFITGKSDDVKAAGLSVAQEWASVGASAKGGKGYYDGDGSNHASIKAEEMEAALTEAKAKYQKLISSGMDEKKAYGIALGAYQESGAVAAPPVGMIASAASAGMGMYDLAKTGYDKGKAWADGAIPNAAKGLRVKASDGSTKTLDQLGISSHADLQSKGGQAFQGGYNDPATLFATSLIQNGMGENFDRVTAQNDAYHNAKSPGSDHTKGTKTDFTVKGMAGKDADLKTAEIMAKYGLQKGIDFDTINEYDAPSAKATGGHIDFKLKEEGRAKIAKIMALERLSNGSGKAATQSNNASGIAATTGATSYYDYGQPSTPVIAKSTNIPTAPVAVIPPKAPDAPAEFSPISSSRAANQSPVNVTLPEFLVGQDVRDRKIAHIATGGISG